MNGNLVTPKRLAKVAVLAVLAALSTATAASAAPDRPRLESPTLGWLAADAAAFQTSKLTASGLERLEQAAWSGRRYATAAGGVEVLVSPAYGSDPATAQRWADFFASLVHGSELALLRAYIAPLDEVQSICGEHALGCYWGNRLVTIGDSSAGYSPASIATHEYGHHVAYNRVNPPWVAVDWGTKRWASYMNICSRVPAGMAFPGDEGENYSLNPGEAFAEAYRVLVETNGTAVGYDWPIVDPSFRPDAQALAAVRKDVLEPWSAPSTKKIRIRFGRGQLVWTRKLATPLDGVLSTQLTTGSDAFELATEGGRTVLAQGSWTGSGGKALEYQICGKRSLALRVTRSGGPRTFTLRLTMP
jgi:hypothetical protein